MATVKIKFRHSAVDGKEGSIYYQIIHKRTIRQITTRYYLYRHEWNDESSSVVFRESVHAMRKMHLTIVYERINRDVGRLKCIIRRFDMRGSHYCADDVVNEYMYGCNRISFQDFMLDVISRLSAMGKYRTSETYISALRSFSSFCDGAEVTVEDVDGDMMEAYEAFLVRRGLVRNTTSFYMRILRAVYNRAVYNGLTVQREPFRRVYTGIDKTRKRAITLKSISIIKNLDLSASPSLDFARDMFLFSFFTRGMSFIDMAFLKQTNLQHGVLTYRRHKTGQRLSIKWEQCMQRIVDKYSHRMSAYLLPIICTLGDIDAERRQYRNALSRINIKLKEIASLAGIGGNLTMYVSRHSWASAARINNVPISVISEGMGHDSETTTQIYLSSLESSAVDRANTFLLQKL